MIVYINKKRFIILSVNNSPQVLIETNFHVLSSENRNKTHIWRLELYGSHVSGYPHQCI